MIYIGDSSAYGKDLQEYDEQDIDFLLRLDHLVDDLIRVHTISDEEVPFEVDTSPPFSNLPDERWDLISETSLKCPTKTLLIKGLFMTTPHLSSISNSIKALFQHRCEEHSPQDRSSNLHQKSKFPC